MLNKNGNRLLRTLRPAHGASASPPAGLGYQQFPFRAANKQTRVRAPKPPAGRRSPETRRRRARPTAEPGDCPKFSPLFPGGHFISLATPAGAHSVRPRAPIDPTHAEPSESDDAFQACGAARTARRGRTAGSSPAAHRTAAPPGGREPLTLPRAASPPSPTCLAGESSLVRRGLFAGKKARRGGPDALGGSANGRCSSCLYRAVRSLFCFLA